MRSSFLKTAIGFILDVISEKLWVNSGLATIRHNVAIVKLQSATTGESLTASNFNKHRLAGNASCCKALHQKSALRTFTGIFLVASLGLMLNGCGQKAREEAERLNQENLALQQQLAGQEEAISQFLGSINEIEENLALIREKERIISQGARGNVEGQPDQMERINEDIRLIGELMQRNRNLMNRLNRDLRNSNLRLGEFEQRVAQLNDRLVERENEIALLKDELGRMNIRVDYLTLSIDTLQQEVQDRARTIERKTVELNTAYYTMGSRRELLEWGVITRAGGFLGIGKTNRLSPNFDHEQFNRIDITNTKEITIAGVQSTFITPHPEGTYEFRYAEGIKTLVILDSEKFWSNSRYLVIEITR